MKGVDSLFAALDRGGEIHLNVYMQASGPYCTIAGLGVHAGGYATLEAALKAWEEGRAVLEAQRAAA